MTDTLLSATTAEASMQNATSLRLYIIMQYRIPYHGPKAGGITSDCRLIPTRVSSEGQVGRPGGNCPKTSITLADQIVHGNFKTTMV